METLREPVFVVFTSRSGSSLVTSIFAAHGLWLGTQDASTNCYGYRNYENVHIKQAIDNIFIVDKQHPARLKHYRPGFGSVDLKAVFSIVPPGERLVYKVGIDVFNHLDGLFEGARAVFVQRNIKSVVASLAAKSGQKSVDILPNVMARYSHMLQVSKDRPMVDTDELLAGDFSSLEAAFDYCGIVFDAGIAKRMIDPAKWRH